MTVAQDIQKFNTGAVVELFKLDASTLGQPVFYFCGQTNEKGQAVVFNGTTYAALAVSGEGWAKQLNGAAPRPTLTIDNTNRFLQSAVISAGDLVSATLTRTRVFAQYLDATNFVAGNVNADPTQTLSVDAYVIERKVAHDNKIVSWELCWPFDRVGLKLPRRLVLRDLGFPGVGLNL